MPLTHYWNVAIETKDAAQRAFAPDSDRFAGEGGKSSSHRRVWFGLCLSSARH
jgi:hypothetical protein